MSFKSCLQPSESDANVLMQRSRGATAQDINHRQAVQPIFQSKQVFDDDQYIRLQGSPIRMDNEIGVITPPSDFSSNRPVEQHVIARVLPEIYEPAFHEDLMSQQGSMLSVDRELTEKIMLMRQH